MDRLTQQDIRQTHNNLAQVVWAIWADFLDERQKHKKLQRQVDQLQLEIAELREELLG